MALRVWDVVERWIIGILGTSALVICLWQIIGRYLSTSFATSWGEELSVYLIIWATLLTASGLVRDDGHVRADLIVAQLSDANQRRVEIFNCAVAVAFCAGLAWFGYLVTRDAYELGERSMTSLSFPMWLYYAALPTTAELMTVRYVIRLVQFVFWYDPAAMRLHSNQDS